MRQRLLLCFLLGGVMLYYAVPRLSLTTGGKESLFAAMWLLLALFVMGGNLAGMLYQPKKQKAQKVKAKAYKRKRIHYYQ
ncbi:hypothetical protein D0469_05380 [Peribacillus saganii]|uniref:Uncharacterized protein n=1 Tax=Peribacillus saganii TaxID=2303992 RepID=A0A372LSH9_9BACI|nr:hypothetical protein [Peribacillus saganii]RFU70752.1 hypothetical protein D0469_05380 [Peribacillus saganii]